MRTHKSRYFIPAVSWWKSENWRNGWSLYVRTCESLVTAEAAMETDDEVAA